ncbi:MAG: hypothetical protein K8Q97_03495 [Candidatus Andersenbacteria bacterium]|nr:hypothetical protein [Candidatus Andersenbacteria bacterium]
MKTISFIPPKNVAEAASLGLEFRKKFGRGGTEIGIARAQELRRRETISLETIMRMVSYFARHEVDKKAPRFGDMENPSNGYIAWLLWGGDEGKKWAEGLKEIIRSA